MELTIIAKLLSATLMFLFIIFAMNPSPRLGRGSACVVYATLLAGLLTPIYMKYTLFFMIIYFIYDFIYPKNSRHFEIISIGSLIAYMWFPKVTEAINSNLDVFYSLFS